MTVSQDNKQDQKRELTVSVRELVEYVLRSGDLKLTFFSAERSAQGIRIHQLIQAARPVEYTPEVPVRHVVENRDYLLCISGRIDGVYDDGQRVVVEEIKTTRRDRSIIQEEDDPVHWGQAKCYAYIYALQNNLDQIDVQLTYYQIEEDKRVEMRRSYSTGELDHFFGSLVAAYLKWVDTVVKWIEIRDRSIDKMAFPYADYRPGQEEMINASTAAIEDRIPLLIQAPTGIGKTMAVIYPALRGLMQGQTDRIFYLTARTTGRNTAEQSLETLRADGLRCKFLSITAKEKVCFCPAKSCDGEECEYARGFYDRINEALADAYSGEVFTRENIVTIARRHRVCPFEFSLELSLWVDVIICDYNYLFDPRVYLRRFLENENNNYVVLVDEAHNLVDRSREMYSAALRRLAFSSIRRSVRKKLPALYRILGKINTWMIKAGKIIPEGESVIALEECPMDLCRLLRKFTTAAEHWLSRNEEAKFRDDLLDLYFDVRRFLTAADRYGTNYGTYYSVAGSAVIIKIFCIDPSDHLRETIQKCRSTIFFSATLTPVEYFVKLFGCEDSARVVSLPSPFPSDNLCVLVAGKISAMYKYREFTKDEVARMIAAMIDRKKGNYLVFFPSYDYMRMVHAMFQRRRPQVELIMQEPGMSEQQRDEFLMNFSARSDGYLTGFAVMGGFFAESIDLVGERLTGAAVVGVGFPRISVERDLIRAYFDGQNGQGFAFAYQVPGMIKVLQAAGRVIRSEDDKGVVLLIDTRYTRPPYSLMFPEGWQPLFISSVEKAGAVLQEFWKTGIDIS